MDKTIRIKPICDCYDNDELYDLLTKMCKIDNKWNNLEITKEDIADYYIILNKPQSDDKFETKKTIFFQMAPKLDNTDINHGIKTWGKWANPDGNLLLQVRNHQFFPNNFFWHFNKTYSQLATEKIPKSDMKSEVISAIVTSNYFSDGQKLRLDFLKYLQKRDPTLINIYGRCRREGFTNFRGELPPFDKSRGLYPYKYTFATESASEINYFTEKIVDPILSETLCFYWGCPNLENYFPKAFIRLELNDFEEDYLKMKQCLEKDEWSNKLDYIRVAKYRIINQMQILPTLENIIRVHQSDLINKFFDKIVIINLKESKQRWDKMESQLKSNGIYNYERFEAIDVSKAKSYGWSIPKAHQNRATYNINFEMQLACKLSHYEVIKLAKERGYNNVLVMEDDLIFEEEKTKKLNLALQEVVDKNIDWDFLYFCLSFEKLDKQVGSYVHKFIQAPSCCCYATNAKCYDKIIQIIEKQQNDPVADIFCNHIHSNFNCYVIKPFLINSDPESVSLISSIKIPQFPNYMFYSNKDSPDFDMMLDKTKSIEELRRMCDNDEGCAGFNTLGFFKYKIVPEDQFISIPYATKISDGLYVKIIPDEKTPRVAIIVPVTSRKCNYQKVEDTHVLKTLVTAFKRTYSRRYHYKIYLGFDRGDKYYDNEKNISEIKEYFNNFIKNKYCQIDVLGFDDTMNSPAQVWTKLFKQALSDGHDYFFQIGDDIDILTSDWDHIFITSLQNNGNFGVVGPRDLGNNFILTQSFVHKTHYKIFGYYFPPSIKNWFCDDWMHGVYKPFFLKKIDSILIRNSTIYTPRYEVFKLDWKTEVQNGIKLIEEYLKKEKAEVKQKPEFEQIQ